MRCLLVLIMTSFAMALWPASCAIGQEPIKLGALYNLTGDMSVIDQPAYNGARLAVEVINQQGGLLEGRKVELIGIDTKSEVDAVMSGAKDILTMGVVAGLGYGDSDYVLAAAPAFRAQDIPFVTSGATDPDLPKQIGKCLFMMTFGDDDQALAMADFAYTSLKIRRVAVWSDKSTEFTRVLSYFFKDRFADIGGTISSEDVFLRKRKDFSALITKLKTLEPPPDAVFVSDVSDDVVAIVSQLRKAGVTMPILSGDGFDVDLVSALPSRDLADDIYFSTHSYRGDTRAKAISFIESYRKKYGKDPENAFAALGYDTVGLIADAMSRAGTTEAKALTATLANTRAFEGVTGHISYARPSRVPTKTIAIVGVKKGKYEVLATSRPR